jgi:hypothetical protein
MYSVASVHEIDCEKLAYFILSVLWRGSVHSWKWGKDQQETGRLGDRYEEEFRKFLLGEGPFPKNAAVQVFLLARPEMWNGFTVPVKGKVAGGLWRYVFIFLGISFHCLLGNSLNNEDRNACIFQSPNKFMFIGDEVDEVFIRDFRPAILKSKPVGKIRKKT